MGWSKKKNEEKDLQHDLIVLVLDKEQSMQTLLGVISWIFSVFQFIYFIFNT